MVGKTNARTDVRNFAVDEHTVFLLTDTIEDKSRFHSNIINNNVTIDTKIQRDGRNSLYFNGSNAYLAIDKYDFINGAKDWCIEFWEYYPNTDTTTGRGSVIYIGVDAAISEGSYGGLLFGHTFQARCWFGNGVNGWNILGDWNLGYTGTQNTWTHWVINRENFVIRIFKDGVVCGSTTQTAQIRNCGSVRPTIGMYARNNFRPMYLQDFRISDVARYNAAFTPPTRFL